MIASSETWLRVEWLGHAAFAIAGPGARVVLDPHRPGALGGRFRLPAIAGPFDAIACSHGHEDHAAWTPALGTTRWIERDDAVGALQLRFLAAAHDDCGGRRMGLSRLIEIRCGSLRVVHSGDLGSFGRREIDFAAGCDALLLACGGHYTLGADAAAAFARAVQPRRVVPMHCADPLIDLALEPAEAFCAALGWQESVDTALTLPLPLGAPPSAIARLTRPDATREPQ